MKLALISIFVLAIMVSSEIQREKQYLYKSKNLREMHMGNYGTRGSNSLKLNMYSLIREEIEREKLKKFERDREQEEEKRRKILNEHLMPLTRGNSFMKDFYSGRY